MNGIDWITMLGNFSRVLAPIQELVSYLAFLVGCLFCFTAIMKLYKIADYRPNSSSQEKAFVPIFYFMGGVALIYLSSAITTASATLFGSAPTIFDYSRYNPYDVRNSMGLLIQTAGLIWAARGIVLMIHASEPGTQEGIKGFVFFIAGIIAWNFESTIDSINWMLQKLISWTLAAKTSQGY